MSDPSIDSLRTADTCTVVGGQVVAVERASLERGATVGRYLVIDRVGEGGMGVVVRAYDPKLHREIALKQLHRDALDSDAEARLLREAQAMAQLSHPNVVTIYDVDRTDEGVVMAMEYAEGQTLAEWIKAGPHPWPEVLGRFDQAGRGLQAAHEAGLVHRDFKPGNAIAGPDGRVRVMDFGLARADRGPVSQGTEEDGFDPMLQRPGGPTGDPDGDRSISGSLSLDLTQAGAVLGTPAYMAPEQHRGAPVDARGDQYAFCVSMWEALWGERPFRGTLAKLALGKHKGPPAMPRGGRVPRHVYEAIRRGLSPKPDNRWPSMNALLDALADDPRRRRRRTLAVGATVVALAGGAGLAALAWPEPAVGPCRDAAQQLAGVWDDAKREQVHAALRSTSLSYADPTWERVAPRLDAYADEWVAMHTEACEATAIRRVQSDALLDLRMQCLRRRKLHLSATVDVLVHATPEVAKTAIQQVMGMPPLDGCADVDALTAAVPPPERPEVARAVETLRDELTRTEALTRAGRYDDARTELETLLERTHGIEYLPLEAEVLLASANLARLHGHYERAVKEATAAYQTGLRAGADAVAADAAAIAMYVTGHRQAKVDVGRAWAASALPLAQRVDPSGVEEAMVINGMGVLAYRDGDFALATRYFEQALPMLVQAVGESDDRVATNLNHLGAMLDEQGRFSEAEPHFRRALEIQTQVFGAEHPRPTISMDNLALCLQAQGRNEEARDLHLAALDVRRAALGDDHPDSGLTRNNLGWDHMGMGQPRAALEHFTKAREIFEAAFGPKHPRVAMALESLALAHAELDQYDEAEAMHRSAMAIRKAALGDTHPNVALSLGGLGGLAYERGDHERAADLLRQALDILDQHEGVERYLGDTLTSYGKALLALERFDEARTQLERALELRNVGAGHDPAVVAKLFLHLADAAWGQADRERAHGFAQKAREHLGDDTTESVQRVRDELDAWVQDHP